MSEEEKAGPAATIHVEDGHPMAAWIDAIPMPPALGDLVEGKIIAISRGRVYVELPPFGTGIIYGREYLNAADVLRKANQGDTISAKVIDPAGREGYIELSLKEARQAAIWGEAEQAILAQTPYSLTVEEANKGGLILSWQGIQGFLPASQLSKEHYPRVPEGDKEKILGELMQLIGHPLSVRIITADAKEGKLIFSERTENEAEEKASLIDKYQVGDTALGEVTGIVDFGVFVKLEPGLEGLVHISELDWGLVEDPHSLFNVGDEVRVKVIEIKDGKISLSIKALRENPWHTAAGRYKKGMEVPGVVIKYNKHGALASIEEGVAGLVHVSEFATPAELRETLELGKTYPFTISLFEPKEQRMTLTFAGKKK
ncbi:S1 RNA-binding domain-containing protein [Patescibacteria group bacterium]|nr:S1 RNA-binding domain-containing protein [Patescibacteria group bacterium]MDE2173190.1 30S ribosomal protein S1 [Patescibacteria group bacterium]